MNLNEYLPITIEYQTEVIHIKPSKANRIYIGFLELIFDTRYSVETMKLDLTSLNEGIEIEFNKAFSREQISLIYDISNVAKIMQNDIFNKLDKYHSIKKYVTMVEFGNYSEFDIQSILLVLSYYHLGIVATLEDSTLSEESKDRLKDVSDKFYCLCKKYFSMSGNTLAKFGQPDIVEFVKTVKNTIC